MNKELRINFHKDPATLDPRKSGDFISSAAIFLLFKGLTRLEANQKVTYDVADSIQISEDLKKYVFHLGNCHWSDGKEITAFDFENSWKTVLRPEFPSLSAHLFYPIKNAEKAKNGQISLDEVGVHAKNSQTLIIELEHPTPYFLELTGFCSFFPVPSHQQDQFLKPGAGFISSGPFTLELWDQGKELVFKKNIHSRNLYPVLLDSISIRIIPDEKVAFSLFEKGELDWMGDPISPLPLSYLPKLLESRIVKPVGGITSCFFNTKQTPFSNLHLRKAFSFAMRREKILEKLLLPHAHAATSPVPPILKGNNLKTFFQDGDISAAGAQFQKALLELKAKPSQLQIVLAFEATEMSFRIAKCLQEDWQEAFSISIQLEPLEFKALYDRLTFRQFTVAFTNWAAQYNDPMNILERFKFGDNIKNFSGWEDAAYVGLLNRYMKTTQQEKRLDLVDQAETLLINQMPIAPIYYFHYSYLQKPYLKNLAVSPIGVFHFDRVSLNLSH